MLYVFKLDINSVNTAHILHLAVMGLRLNHDDKYDKCRAGSNTVTTQTHDLFISLLMDI